MKEHVFSLTKDDFEIQTFRSGGKGGQHQNKTDSGVRIIHAASGAVGESREEREQIRNKKTAFKKLCENPKFKAWLRVETGRRLGQESIESLVEKAMDPKNIKTEIKQDGVWTEKEGSELT
jgi:peptide chain release factor 1